jgi:hypothetical protein
MTSAMLQATLEKARTRMKAGKIDCLYRFVDGSGAVGISNAESSEALMADLELAYPAFPFVHFQVLPVAGFHDIIDNLIDTMERQGIIATMRESTACISAPN